MVQLLARCAGVEFRGAAGSVDAADELFTRSSSMTSTRTTEARNLVQACIGTLSFPSTLENLEAMAEKNGSLREWATDMDWLLDFSPSDGVIWTAPRGMRQGDILFFYHAAKATKIIARLMKQAKRQAESDLLRFLGHAEDQANRYSGTIFGAALLAGPTEYYDSDILHDDLHFKGRHESPLAEVCILKKPLPLADFKSVVMISKGANTNISGEQFDALRELLAKTNKLPRFLREAVMGDEGFNRKDWLASIRAGQMRFLNESRIREFFVDPLLEEIKDPKSPVLKECECFRHGERTGVVDYFIKLHGYWLPVEAKLNVLCESDLPGQVNDYLHVESIKPTLAPSRGESFETGVAPPVCLVVDQAGLYLMDADGFLGCDGEFPRWPRETLKRKLLPCIREEIRSLYREYAAS